jgi:hypothetical protein
VQPLLCHDVEACAPIIMAVGVLDLSLWYFGGMGRQFSEQIDADF